MAIEDIIDDLKTLSPARLEMVADFVSSLTRISDEERRAILRRTERVDHGHTRPPRWVNGFVLYGISMSVVTPAYLEMIDFIAGTNP